MFNIFPNKRHQEVLLAIEKLREEFLKQQLEANTDKLLIASLRNANRKLTEERDRYKIGVDTLTASVKNANAEHTKLKDEFVKVLQSAITNNNRTQMLAFLHTHIKNYLP